MKKEYLFVLVAVVVSLVLVMPVAVSVPLVQGEVQITPSEDFGLPQFFYSNITLYLEDAVFSIDEVTFNTEVCDVKARAYKDDDGKTLAIKADVLMKNCEVKSSAINATFAELTLNLDVYLSDDVAYYEVCKEVHMPLILSFFSRKVT